MSASVAASTAAAASSIPLHSVPNITSTAAVASLSSSSDLLPYLLNQFSDFFSFNSIWDVSEKQIKEFQFVHGVTPLSSTIGVALCVALYVGIVRAMEYYVRKRGKPFDLNWYVILHNSLMSILSAVLWFSMVYEVYRLGSTSGWWSFICDPTGLHTAGKIYFIYYVNYIFKYVELIDTFLLALRGKPIPFLHIYHHAATLVLCWSQLSARSCIQWLPILINLMVHIIMYFYYTLHALGVDIWWKKYLTRFQILQFIAALTGCILAFSSRIMSHYFELLPQEVYNCHGTYSGGWIGIAVIASYLYLFMILYKNTYKKGKGRVAGQGSDRAAAIKPLGLNNPFQQQQEKTNGNGVHLD